MKIQRLRFAVALCFVALFSVVLVKSQKTNNEIVSTTTEKDVFISSLERIISKIESTKDRINKTLSESRANDIKMRHDLLAAKGYQLSSGIGYHRLYLTKLSWHDALNFCSREDAHLTVIDSAAEGTALAKLVKEKLPSISYAENVAYIGLHDYCKNGWINVFFKTLDNNSNYILWKQDMPNHSGQNCAAIDEDGYLSSLRCTTKQAFICEMKL